MKNLATCLEDVLEQISEDFLQINGVHAVGLGPKRIAGNLTEALSIVVLVEKKIPKSELHSGDVIPEKVNGVPTDVIESARIKSREQASSDLAASDDLVDADSRKYDPLAGGCRIAADNGTGWGTLGTIVNSQTGKPAILTAKHVVKDTGRVYQPGRTERPVASVTKTGGYDWCYCELNEGVEWTNYLLDAGPIQDRYVVTSADLPYPVVKRGYRTGISDAKITLLGLRGYDTSGIYYSSSMYVEGADGTLMGGDSGSVLVDDQYRLVGMLYDAVDARGREAIAASIDVIENDLGMSVIKTNFPPLYMVYSDAENRGCIESENINDHWNGIAELHLGTVGSPGLVTYRNKLYCMRQADMTHELRCAVNDGVSWGQDVFLGAGTSYRPGLAVYKGLLYCIHQGYGFNEETYMMTFDGQTWSGDQKLSFPTDRLSPPSLAVYRGKLHCFRVGGNAANRILYSAFDGRTWSADIVLAPTNDPDNQYGTLGPPAVVSYKGRLYCIHTGASGNTNVWSSLWYFTFDGQTWSSDNELYAGATWEPSAIVKNDILYCFHQAYDASVELYYMTFDGNTWSADTLMEPSLYKISQGPGLAFLPSFKP